MSQEHRMTLKRPFKKQRVVKRPCYSIFFGEVVEDIPDERYDRGLMINRPSVGCGKPMCTQHYFDVGSCAFLATCMFCGHRNHKYFVGYPEIEIMCAHCIRVELGDMDLPLLNPESEWLLQARVMCELLLEAVAEWECNEKLYALRQCGFPLVAVLCIKKYLN